MHNKKTAVTAIAVFAVTSALMTGCSDSQENTESHSSPEDYRTPAPINEDSAKQKYEKFDVNVSVEGGDTEDYCDNNHILGQNDPTEKPGQGQLRTNFHVSECIDMDQYLRNNDVEFLVGHGRIVSDNGKIKLTKTSTQVRTCNGITGEYSAVCWAYAQVVSKDGKIMLRVGPEWPYEVGEIKERHRSGNLVTIDEVVVTKKPKL